MSIWLALTVLVAVGLTYLCCIRPMRRGTCGAGGRRTDGTEQASRREEIDRLRAEITQARHDLQAGPRGLSHLKNAGCMRAMVLLRRRPMNGQRRDRPKERHMTRPAPHRHPSGTKTSRAGQRGTQPTSAAPDKRRLGVVLVLVVLLVVVLVVVLPRVLGSGGDPRSKSGGRADPGVAHVHGLGVDPRDKTLYAATHFGVFRIPEQGAPTRIADRFQDTMGFTVVGPRHFLGSGHPDPIEGKPPNLGLIESTDGGQTWRDLSLTGQADFHSLQAAHGQIFGYNSTTGTLMVSNDKITWDERATLPMADFAVSPASPDVLIATTENGPATSSDGGRTFAVIDGAPPLVFVSWPQPAALYGVTASGAILHSLDQGKTWQQQGSVDGRPAAITATDANTIYAATNTGIYESTDAGRTFTPRYRISQ